MQEYLESVHDPAAFMVSEIGIGLNPKCTLSGALLEDEGVLGSVHFGLGSNTSLGGEHHCNLHLDIMSLESSLIFDGETIINNGKILLNDWV